MDLLPHQRRVIAERDELDTKVQALSAFLDSDSRPLVDPAELSRMSTQMYHMRQYLWILDARIAAFVMPSLTDADAAADLAGTPRPDHPSTNPTE